jgi:hypothetical protein
MLRLTLELLPAGRDDRAANLGELRVWNVSGPADIADYHAVVETTPKANCGATLHEGAVHGFDRTRPVWELVTHALLSAVRIDSAHAASRRAEIELLVDAIDTYMREPESYQTSEMRDAADAALSRLAAMAAGSP